MADDVKLDYSGLKKLFDDFGHDANEAIHDLMPTVAEMLVSAVQEEWDTEGEGKWQKLADSTIAKRRQGGGGAKILQDSGHAAGSVMQMIGSDFAQAFTNVPYMVFHTSDAPRTKIPYRNPFDIDEERVQEEVAEMLLKVIAP